MPQLCPLCHTKEADDCCEVEAARRAALAARNAQRQALLEQLGIEHRQNPISGVRTEWVIEPDMESLFAFLAELPFSAVPASC
jgi:hypothetical protein